jgi:hypothetical protein
LLYNEYLEIPGFKSAGAWCFPTNAISSDDVEERAKVYLCCTMSILNVMGLKRPGLVLSN